jgi:predicted ATP-grasp superfamily ATP-dependent carboligase
VVWFVSVKIWTSLMLVSKIEADLSVIVWTKKQETATFFSYINNQKMKWMYHKKCGVKIGTGSYHGLSHEDERGHNRHNLLSQSWSFGQLKFWAHLKK